MTKICKKEQLILNRIARTKMRTLKDNPIIQQAVTEIQAIKPWPLARFSTEEQLETEILAYIEKQKQENKPLTITGLAITLWIDRNTLLKYSKKELFGSVITKYKQVLLEQVEENLTDRAKFTPGQIFYLKNNYKQDYSDRVEIEHTWSISLVELNKRAMMLEDCDIIDSDDTVDTDVKLISPARDDNAEA